MRSTVRAPPCSSSAGTSTVACSSNPGTAETPLTLLAFLNDVLARRPELRVFALAWDFSVLFTLEREPLPTYRFAWNAHPRLAFHLDDAHPFGASHHQKIVVVDDAIAFAGGLDLAIRRWDTPAHLAREPGRVDPVGRPYPPMHDVQMMVDGDAAAALGELARARWHAATGRLAAPDGPPAAPAADLWPDANPPDIHDAPIGIARTMPAFREAPAVQEISAIALQSIAAARRFIYIENQYLTSAAVGAALARRLAGARRPRSDRRAPARGTRLAGAELDGRHARAPAAPPAHQRPPRPSAALLPDHSRPR